MTNKIFHRQLLHVIVLGFLLGGLFALFSKFPPKGEWLGWSAQTWVLLSIAIPIVHQVYVWFVWRFELYGGHISKVLGQAAFPLYCGGFSLLFIPRFLAILGLAVATHRTGDVHSSGSIFLGIILLFPGLFALYSVARYFGLRRAFGADHFFEEYRKMPLEARGIYKVTSNGMYLYAFLIFYVPGFLFESWEALTVALFSHLYIWVHFYCTELPDMEFIYRDELRDARKSTPKDN